MGVRFLHFTQIGKTLISVDCDKLHTHTHTHVLCIKCVQPLKRVHKVIHAKKLQINQDGILKNVQITPRTMRGKMEK